MLAGSVHKAEGESIMRLRRRIATLLGASLFLSTSAVALSTQSPSGAAVEGIIDVAVSIEAKPSVVSPPGEYALYDVRASNPGIISVSSSTVTVALPSGSVYDDSLSTGSCAGAGTTVTCPVGTLAPGATEVFDVVASTPTTPGVVKASASIEEHDDLTEPLEYKGNNTDETEVDVRAASGAGAFGLVRENESLSLDVGDGRKYTLTVPPGVPGVIASIEPDDGGGKVCGESINGCGKGFLTDFVKHPYFKAEDPANPLLTTKTFGPKDPCQGLAPSSNCFEIYWAKSSLEPVLFEMDPCQTAGQAVPSPCLNGRPKRVSGSDGKKSVWFDVLMLSNDPLELPPLSLGT